MATGYEDIEKLTAQKQDMLDNSLKQQNDIINKQTQMNVDTLERQKADIDKEAIQQNRALYQDYRRANNPFGTQAENLASQGLGNSGYAETTMSRLYNTYQNNITSTLNNARDLKADVDFQISQARQNGDITLAQNALELYKQKMQLLSEEYDLRNNREQFLYQKSQDALAQRNWQTEFDYKKAQDTRNYNYQVSRDKVSDSQWQKSFDYQKSRDKVSDSQWQKEYELSKKARASSTRRSSGYSRSSGKSSSNTTSSINNDDDTSKKSNNSDILKKILETADAMLKKTKTGRLAQAVAKTGARQYIYRAYENGTISEKDAKNLYNKLGLEK